jgi:hypothetical protein
MALAVACFRFANKQREFCPKFFSPFSTLLAMELGWEEEKGSVHILLYYIIIIDVRLLLDTRSNKKKKDTLHWLLGLTLP